MHIARHVVVAAVATLVLSCAEGSLDGSNNQQLGPDTEATDVLASDTGSDTGSYLDGGHSGDIWDARPDDGGLDATADGQGFDVGGDTGGGFDVGDVSTSDGSNDSGGWDTGGADTGSDSGGDTGNGGPCGQTCVDGVCDPNTGSCVECLVDGDCMGAGLCDDQAKVCVPDCCTPLVEDAFTNITDSSPEFDIAVTDGGSPMIVFADEYDDKIELAERFNGQWYTQTVDTNVPGSFPYIALAIDSTGVPHIIMSDYEVVRHYWRPQSTWMSHDLLFEPVLTDYVDIVVDAKDTVHMIAIFDYSPERVHYASFDAQGQRNAETWDSPVSDPLTWANLGATSDGRPIASFDVGLADQVLIAEMNTGGNWVYETVGTDISQVHGMDVGPNDQPVVAFRYNSNDGPRLLSRSGTTWHNELIVNNSDHGYYPHIAVDDVDNPHIIYRASLGVGNYPPYYGYWDGNGWASHEVSTMPDVGDLKIAVDGNRTGHAAIEDEDRDTISYVRFDPQ